jgi:hypothetical protein
LSDILSDLQAYARRNELESRRHAERAAEIKALAEERVSRTVGAGAESVHQQIRARAELEAAAEADLARFKVERAKLADKGLMLVRYPEEYRDLGFMRDHASLRAAAHAAGLVTDRLE